MTEGPARRLLDDLFAAGIAACDPGSTLRPHLDHCDGPAPTILAVGKAAAAMAAVARDRWPDAVGLIVARRGETGGTPAFPTILSGHPDPDDNSLRAGAALLDRAASADENGDILFLLSGGASALAVSPSAGVSLYEKSRIARCLARAGAPIEDLNTVRRHLSELKGGRLAAAAFPARVTTFAISDVVSNAPEAIGSGPTVADPTTNRDAREICARYGVPIAGIAFSESVKPGDPRLGRLRFAIVASAAHAIAAIAESARRRGFEPIVLGVGLEGEAREVGADHARTARDAAASGRRAALISGGELTVAVAGCGIGGPNFEYAAALALGIDGVPSISALSADSDGIDGNSNAAGAYVDGTSAEAARRAGAPLETALAGNDCATAFEKIGAAFAPGPTGANVNDLRVILVGAP